MENPNHLNDPNVRDCDQAPAAPDGFAPQWIGDHDPNNNNGWIEWDVPLGGEVDEPMVDLEVNEETMRSIYCRNRGTVFSPPSTWTSTVIEDLSTRLGNLEYRHGVLLRKMEEVSDAEAGQVVSRLKEIETRVQQVESRVDPHPSGQMAVQGHDMIVRSSQQVQTLQTALHETESQNQQLRTRVAKMESHMGIVMSYMLWMEECLTVLEKRLPGPPPGPCPIRIYVDSYVRNLKANVVPFGN
nr:hypothetical protein [Tanacetum cinerariifolium]